MPFRKLLLTALLAAPLAAQGPREKLIVTPQWLNDHLNDRNLVVIHVGPKAGYDTAHIAGARFVDQNTFFAPQGAPPALTYELPSPDSLRAGLARMGVTENSRIIVYASEPPRYPQATRIVLTLDHAGFGEAASLLDGGLAAWTRAGFKTTTEVPAPAAANLAQLKTKVVTVPAEFVRDNVGKPGIVVIDGRAAAFYDGLQESGAPDARKKGHIKGAQSVPYTELVDAQGLFKPAADLQALFNKAGAKPGDTIVGYCHIGQQATAMLFAARTLGYQVKLYDGSFEDWARRGWPIEPPPGE